jgi:hypothetical protein
LRYLVLSVLAVLAACGPRIEYQYVAPKTAEGRVCAAQCQNGLQQCRQNQQSQHALCQSQRQAARQSYNACVEAGGENCSPPPICPVPIRRECTEQFNACFTACGGQVKVIQLQR